MPSPTLDWQIRKSGGPEFFELSPLPNLALAFFTRRGGTSRPPFDSLNLSYQVGDSRQCVDANFHRVGSALRLPGVFTLQQVHSDRVVQVGDPGTRTDLLEGDALFTTLRGVGLAVKTADCLPVYIWSRNSDAIGIAHCGWRGTVARVAAKLAHVMSRHLSAPLPNFDFSTGPCICPTCYEVGPDVQDKFKEGFGEESKFIVHDMRLDIRAANRHMLLELGLAEATPLALCSAENQGALYSARRASPTGRNLAVITVRR